MYEPRRKVLWFAILSRITVLILQFIFNILCFDHHADAFKSPLDDTEKISVYDSIVTYLFSGLTRWDGQYFIHIAKYGYTYENTLAFYPLYPMATRAIASLLRKIFFMLNTHSTIIIAALIINFICFVKSAIIFYDLSKTILKNTSIAYKATILYCINPATIFFSAIYSESLFAYLTFYTMLRSQKLDPHVSFPLSLSILVRSNGMVNIGFPIYFQFKRLFANFSKKQNNYSLKTFGQFMCTRSTLQSCYSMCNIIIISIVPFILLQIYYYIIFCRPDFYQLSSYINYNTNNNLVFASNGSTEWCQAKIPLAYSYIQQKYWNVGFMRYYELKQIPNFILAFPVLYIMISCVKEYFLEHKKYFYKLGLVENIEDEDSVQIKKYPPEMFVFIIHGLFLTIFCIFFVHIQVSTRLICSASPIIYWYCASTMSHTSEHNNELQYEDDKNATSKWKVFFLSQKVYNLEDKLILFYCLGYIILGSFMFANFLPWT